MRRIVEMGVSVFLVLSVLAGCSPGPGTSSETSRPVSTAPQTQNVSQTAAAPQTDVVPEFLDEEQQRQYLRAQEAYSQFTLNNDGFCSSYSEDELPETFELDGMQYIKANGQYTLWEDFERAMLEIFTPEYFQELNAGASYTDEGGVYHARTIFAEKDGNLYYSGGARGSNISYIGPDTFELTSETETEIKFDVVGRYAEPQQDESGNWVTGDDVSTTSFPIVLIKAQAGWRFSLFNLTY